MNKLVLVSVFSLISLVACRKRTPEELKARELAQSHLTLDLQKDGKYMAVIEIPAGTNHKIEYHKTKNEFLCDQKNGKDRVIEFLPYPGNYGFLPSTLMDTTRGGDGDALDILIIGETEKTGTYMPIIPVGIMYLMDSGEEDHKLLAVPYDDDKNVLGARKFEDIGDPILHIISDWFAGYKGPGKMSFEGWGDEKKAIEEIKKWELKKE